MTAQAQRRKPVNYGKRRSLRLGADEENAVAAMRQALADVRGVAFDDVDWAEAVRLLLVENEKQARVMAGEPEATAKGSDVIDVPDELWQELADAKKITTHARGSLHILARKLNFGKHVSQQEFAEALKSNRRAEEANQRMEEALLRFIHEQDS